MAAPTLVLLAATPFVTKYLFTDDGTGGGATITLAQLIADAKTAGPGPSALATFLAGLDDTSWPLAPKGAHVSIYTETLTDAASGLSVSALAQNTGVGANSLLVTAKTATALTAIVEVWFHNTIVG